MHKSDVSTILKSAYQQVISNLDGNLASYIPELANIDPDLFAISYVDVHGHQISIGDCESLFTLQSTSKPITYSLALQN